MYRSLMSVFAAPTLILAGLALASCSSTDFTGKSGGTSSASPDGGPVTLTSNDSGTSANASGTRAAPTPAGTVIEGGTSTGTTTTSTVNIPGANPSDLPLLEKCLASWPGNPFSGSTPIQNFKTIYAAVSVLGFGNAINDTDKTPGPELILIDAGVNVLGSPTYSLLNPNGYYCLKVNVNVLTKLTVDLDCAAHLADSRVDVSVLSNTNSSTAAVGVNVLSSVQVDNIRPQGETCVR